MSVRRESLVDRIVACPKCQSMVQLSRANATSTPPVQLGNRPVDSDALTQDSIGNANAGGMPPAPHDPTGSQASEGGLAAPPVVQESHEESGLSDANQGDDSIGAAGDLASPAAPPLDWQSEKSAKSRKLAIMVMSAVAGLLSLIILVMVLMRGNPGGSNTGSAPDGDPQVAQNDAQANSSNPAVADPPAMDSPVPDSTTNENGDAATEDSASDANVDPQTETANSTSNVPSESDPTQDNSATDTEDTKTADPPAMQPPADLLPQNLLLPDNLLLPSNPLEGLTPADPNNPPANNNDGGPEAPTLTELPDALKPFLVGMDIDRTHLPVDAPAPKSLDEIQLDRAAADDIKLEVAVETPRSVNLTAALGLTIAFQPTNPDGYPFGDFALFLSQMTSVPMELEWVSFDLVGTPLTTRIPLPTGKWVSIEEALTSACEAAGASFEKHDSSIQIKPLDARFSEVVTDAIDFSDVKDAKSAVLTARQLLQQSEGDPSAIEIPVNPGPQQLAVMVCEAIRRARGEAGKLNDQNVKRWIGAYKDQLDGWPVLTGGNSGDPLVEPLPLASLVRRFAKRNGATAFVNWQEAAKRDLNPDTMMMPKAGKDISAADALSEVFSPEGIQVRVPDAQHWWIGTEAYFDRLPVVIWFDDQANANRYLGVVRGAIDGAGIDQQFIGAAAVDPVSGKCIAVIPRFLLRQLPRLLES